MGRRLVIELSCAFALIALPCWALAQESAPEVEFDPVTARGEAQLGSRLDADRDAVRREVALARARRVAPFDLSWGIEP